MSPPTESDVLSEIQRIAREELEVRDPVTPTDELSERLDLDSMRLSILAVSLEDRFRIHLREDDAQQVTTVQELARLVVRRAGEEPPC
jgi:acyl carrier protein